VAASITKPATIVGGDGHAVDGGLGFDTAYVDPTTSYEILSVPFPVVITIQGDTVAGVEQVFS
jgi:hypothetical protein